MEQYTGEILKELKVGGSRNTLKRFSIGGESPNTLKRFPMKRRDSQYDGEILNRSKQRFRRDYLRGTELKNQFAYHTDQVAGGDAAR